MNYLFKCVNVFGGVVDHSDFAATESFCYSPQNSPVAAALTVPAEISSVPFRTVHSELSCCTFLISRAPESDPSPNPSPGHLLNRIYARLLYLRRPLSPSVVSLSWAGNVSLNMVAIPQFVSTRSLLETSTEELSGSLPAILNASLSLNSFQMFLCSIHPLSTCLSHKVVFLTLPIIRFSSQNVFVMWTGGRDLMSISPFYTSFSNLPMTSDNWNLPEIFFPGILHFSSDSSST